MHRTVARFRLIPLVALLALVGCSKKTSPVDPSYTVPEGQTDAAGAVRLMLWRDLPWTAQEFFDKAPIGPGPEDSLIGTSERFITSPGVVHAQVLDSTIASSYQALRKESNGGVFPLSDYALRPTRKWLDTHWELYRFEDPAPSGFSPPTYFARGLIGGVVTPLAPLSDAASVSATGPLINIVLAGDRNNSTGPNRDRYRFPRDSLFVIKWTQQVPGAVGYLVQVYQGGVALPSPIAFDTRDYYVAWVPATLDSVKILREQSGIRVLSSRTIVVSGNYFARVAAISATGEMVGITYGDTLNEIADLTYERVPIGAITIIPGRGPTPQASVRPSASSVTPRLPRRY